MSDKMTFEQLQEKVCKEAEAARPDKINHAEVAETVNHPNHYNAGGIECIDAMEAATADLCGMEAICTSNAIKYLWRWKHKNGVEDLEKAKWYINRLIKFERCEKLLGGDGS